MSTILLIHGAWHGAWCWKKVIPELEGLGHKVHTTDLPGHGNHKTPVDEVSLEGYADKIVDVIESIDEKVLLVGHSMGGMAITAVAERCSEKLQGLVYLTAFLPRNHESLFIIEERNPKPTIPPNLILSEDEKSATIASDKLVEIFYHDCDKEDIRFAMESLTPQVIAPLATPVTLTGNKFGSVPRAYIECTDDHAICIELQRDMLEKTPCDPVISLSSSHSPFFSKPRELAEAISGISGG